MCGSYRIVTSFILQYDFCIGQELERFFFLYINEYRTYKQIQQKLQSPGALNIKATPGYKLKENVKKIMIAKNKSKPKN